MGNENATHPDAGAGKRTNPASPAEASSISKTNPDSDPTPGVVGRMPEDRMATGSIAPNRLTTGASNTVGFSGTIGAGNPVQGTSENEKTHPLPPSVPTSDADVSRMDVGCGDVTSYGGSRDDCKG